MAVEKIINHNIFLFHLLLPILFFFGIFLRKKKSQSDSIEERFSIIIKVI